MELMNRIRERVVAWQKTRVRTVVFPLAFCIFPAIFVIVLAPSILSLIETMSKS